MKRPADEFLSSKRFFGRKQFKLSSLIRQNLNHSNIDVRATEPGGERERKKVTQFVRDVRIKEISNDYTEYF